MLVMCFVTGTSDLVITGKSIILNALDEMVVNEEIGYLVFKLTADNACNIVRGKYLVVDCIVKNIKRTFIQHDQIPRIFQIYFQYSTREREEQRRERVWEDEGSDDNADISAGRHGDSAPD